jgi:hypothetical protein
MPTAWKCAKTSPPYFDKRTGCCIMTTHSLTLPFSPRNFWPKTTWLSSSTLFPRLKIKLKGRHFDTIEVTEEESQAVQNTPTEHDFLLCI